MNRALRLAERGRGRTRPNPIVGAVVVGRDGRVAGEGWHHSAGRPHAEVEALARAGAAARNATLYVTLEPCAHHGRTPPCVDAILAAGVRRCVVAMRDPHHIVDGRGIRALRRAGVEVTVGLLEGQARETLAGYRLAQLEGRPRATWKVASTLDAKVADRRGRSHWITGSESRGRVHRMRAAVDAIVVGSGTARADDPRLTVRLAPGRGSGAESASRAEEAIAPLRVVCDTRLELPPTLRLFGPRLAKGTVVACGAGAPARRVVELERRGVRVWRLPSGREGVSPRALARRLAREGCYDVLLESGPRLGGAWVRAGLVDRLALFVAPRVLGRDGLSWCGALPAVTLDRARPGRLVELSRHGDDALLVVELDRSEA